MDSDDLLKWLEQQLDDLLDRHGPGPVTCEVGHLLADLAHHRLDAARARLEAWEDSRTMLAQGALRQALTGERQPPRVDA